MNIEKWFSTELMQALGWSLLHVLWQGALVALVLGVVLLGLQKANSRLRYGLALAGLVTTFIWFVVTFYSFYFVENQWIVTEIIVRDAVVGVENVTKDTSPSFWEKYLLYFEQNLPMVVTFWFLGLLFFTLRLLGELAYLQRLKQSNHQLFSEEWEEVLKEMKVRVGVRRAVHLVESSLVNVPMVLGYLKPMILMPVGVVNQLTLEEVEAIFAHELAHIQRHDYLVNLLQSFIEAVFFFHPAVWWMSNEVRRERENCCDDVALKVTGDRLSVAKALANLEQFRINFFKRKPQMTMAAIGNKNQLLNRVKRLLNQPVQERKVGESFWAACVLVVLFLMVGMKTGENTDNSTQPIDYQEVMVELDTSFPSPPAVSEVVPVTPTTAPAPPIFNENLLAVAPPAPPTRTVTWAFSDPTLLSAPKPERLEWTTRFSESFAPLLPSSKSGNPHIFIFRDTSILGEDEAQEVILIKEIKEEKGEKSKELKIVVKNLGNKKQVEIFENGVKLPENQHGKYKAWVEKAVRATEPEVRMVVGLEGEKELWEAQALALVKEERALAEWAAKEEAVAARIEQEIETERRRAERSVVRQKRDLDRKRVEEAARREAESYRRIAAEREEEARVAHKIHWGEVLKSELLQDGIIQADDERFSFELNHKHLKVNGEKMNDVQFKKYADLYEKLSGKPLTKDSSIRIEDEY